MDYTVAELIEALRKCPANYRVMFIDRGDCHSIVAVAIDHEAETVDLFPND